MASILYVRIKSNLSLDEFDRRMLERRPQFLDVPGLIQKMYGRDPESGDICGIYFFEDEASLEAYRESALAKSIPTAYEAIDVRREKYDVLYALHPDRGPATA
tara:strand:- start:227065 stop:227373 length:309 start_codon:yes stop_codon:yes gene_type:complete